MLFPSSLNPNVPCAIKVKQFIKVELALRQITELLLLIPLEVEDAKIWLAILQIDKSEFLISNRHGRGPEVNALIFVGRVEAFAGVDVP